MPLYIPADLTHDTSINPRPSPGTIAVSAAAGHPIRGTCWLSRRLNHRTGFTCQAVNVKHCPDPHINSGRGGVKLGPAEFCFMTSVVILAGYSPTPYSAFWRVLPGGFVQVSSFAHGMPPSAKMLWSILCKRDPPATCNSRRQYQKCTETAEKKGEGARTDLSAEIQT
ncbi:hypothetical protein BDW74DRAFT_90043 [Aspergillus multicolor]|uniref:uncharacterized protein n=1 Tax=Aspergillus multicolor TaxID=41759 RepID=UPI003CCCBC49